MLTEYMNKNINSSDSGVVTKILIITVYLNKLLKKKVEDYILKTCINTDSGTVNHVSAAGNIT